MTSQFKKFPSIETERLILRELTVEDAHNLYSYYSDREISKYLDWFGPQSEEQAIKMIRYWAKQYQEGTFMRFGIALKTDNKIIGTIPINPVRGTFEWKLPIVIGYELSRVYWNQGLMTEALKAVITYVFEELNNHRIIAEVFPENQASLKVLEKLGFQEEGLLKQHLYHEGTKTWHDVITLALLK
ncbi:GNAT family N-acetyltransferase [Heyndrickxia sporothermodurans]|uniref:GNAT family N-acetyltransferase n=1 Tax=Heyndrickxia sporothermodurans TaxID=46224 RepID=A0AB37HH33_9BACI|nr:GNAT family N-acetyltransferase [Heyndrickxia sporothermodurans]